MICPKCGKANLDSMKECFYCGAKFEDYKNENGEIVYDEEMIAEVSKEQEEAKKILAKEEVRLNPYSKESLWKCRLCILCCFFGVLGIHDFVSNKIARGLIKIALGSIGSVIVCLGSLIVVGNVDLSLALIIIGSLILSYLGVIVVCDLFKILCDVY